MTWKQLKKEFEEDGITYCEICGSCFILTPMHRMKRRYYTKDTLWLRKEVILACVECHQKLEYDREGTRKIFKKLRGGAC